jgi:hypothetical protein
MVCTGWDVVERESVVPRFMHTQREREGVGEREANRQPQVRCNTPHLALRTSRQGRAPPRPYLGGGSLAPPPPAPVLRRLCDRHHCCQPQTWCLGGGTATRPYAGKPPPSGMPAIRLTAPTGGLNFLGAASVAGGASAAAAAVPAVAAAAAGAGTSAAEALARAAAALAMAIWAALLVGGPANGLNPSMMGSGG